MRTIGYGAVSGGPVSADDTYLRIAPHSRDETREEANRRAWRQSLAEAAAVNAAREGKGTVVKVPPKPKSTFSIDSAAVRAKYEDGDSLAQIAMRYGVARETIRRHILEAGGTIRRPPKRAGVRQAKPDVARSRKNFPPDEVLRREYEDGLALRDIALRHSISRTYIAAAIVRAGGTIRPKHVNTGRRRRT